MNLDFSNCEIKKALQRHFIGNPIKRVDPVIINDKNDFSTDSKIAYYGVLSNHKQTTPVIFTTLTDAENQFTSFQGYEIELSLSIDAVNVDFFLSSNEVPDYEIPTLPQVINSGNSINTGVTTIIHQMQGNYMRLLSRTNANTSEYGSIKVSNYNVLIGASNTGKYTELNITPDNISLKRYLSASEWINFNLAQPQTQVRLNLTVKQPVGLSNGLHEYTLPLTLNGLKADDNGNLTNIVDTMPSSPTASGKKGQIYIHPSGNGIYFCYADDNWRFIAMSTSGWA